MKVKLWIATYVDRGETCDGKARVLGVYDSKEEAVMVIRNDIEHWADDHAGDDIEVDFDQMRAYYIGNDVGCEWNVEECEVNDSTLFVSLDLSELESVSQ